MVAKERRCLKFTGYIYIPESNETKVLRYYAAKTPGRLIIYDEYGQRPTGKALAFDELGQMISFIEKAKKKLVYKRVRRK